MKLIKRIINNKVTLPSELLSLSTITITGDKNILIEQHYKLLSFTDEEILLRCESGTIQINGKQLMIKVMYSREITLEGTIEKITFHK